jgi:hypothetical protein
MLWRLCREGAAEHVERHRFPFLQMAEVFLLWAGFLVLQLLKSRYSHCSARFLGIYAVQARMTWGQLATAVWPVQYFNVCVCFGGGGACDAGEACTTAFRCTIAFHAGAPVSHQRVAVVPDCVAPRCCLLLP